MPPVVVVLEPLTELSWVLDVGDTSTSEDVSTIVLVSSEVDIILTS